MSPDDTERSETRPADDDRERLLADVAAELSELQAAMDALDGAIAEWGGINRTDLQCLGFLFRRGPMTAGQLADESGLTPGAITTALDRLERAGLAERRRDEADRRRVLVEITPAARGTAARFYTRVAAQTRAAAERFTTAELGAVRDFLRNARDLHFEVVAEIHLQGSRAGGGSEAADEQAGRRPATLAGIKAGRLEFPRGAANVTIRADASLSGLHAASFEGSPPDIRVDGGTISVEYPRRFRAFDWRRHAVHLRLNPAVPWSVEVRGGVAGLEADLGGLEVSSFDMTGGAARIEVWLPRPHGTVPVRLSGGASSVAFHRPRGTAASARLTGGAAKLTFDDQQIGAFGGLTRLESRDYAAADDRYDFRVTGGASSVTIDAPAGGPSASSPTPPTPPPPASP